MKNLNNKTILITGGTGSFGKKFIEIVLKKYKLKKIIVFSRDEQKQFNLQKIFPESSNSPIRYYLGDVRDYDRVRYAFQEVDVVIQLQNITHLNLLKLILLERKMLFKRV
jgi:UDP-N-acetylglucosamine 4,6-dehydratase